MAAISVAVIDLSYGLLIAAPFSLRGRSSGDDSYTAQPIGVYDGQDRRPIDHRDADLATFVVIFAVIGCRQDRPVENPLRHFEADTVLRNIASILDVVPFAHGASVTTECMYDHVTCAADMPISAFPIAAARRSSKSSAGAHRPAWDRPRSGGARPGGRGGSRGRAPRASSCCFRSSR
jgi:hypothetical protein